jgi:hypothetical protein
MRFDFLSHGILQPFTVEFRISNDIIRDGRYRNHFAPIQFFVLLLLLSKFNRRDVFAEIWEQSFIHWSK